MIQNDNHFKNIQLLELIAENSKLYTYKGRMKTDMKFICIKIASDNTRYVYKQFLILDILKTIKGIPKPFSFGYNNDEKFYYITNYYEKSLNSFLGKNATLSLQSVLSIGLSLLRIFEAIHSHDVIYGNLCPENIMFSNEGSDHDSRIHLIGYSEARSLYDPPREKRASPALQYQSCSYHKTGFISKVDELESLGYLLIKLRTGHLEWENQTELQMGKDKKEFLKSNTAIKGMPQEFKLYFLQLNSFNDEPKYYYLSQLLSAMMFQHCHTNQHLIQELTLLTPILEVQSDVFISQDNFFLSGRLKQSQNQSSAREQTNPDSDSSVEGKIKGLELITSKIKLISSL